MSGNLYLVAYHRFPSIHAMSGHQIRYLLITALLLDACGHRFRYCSHEHAFGLLFRQISDPQSA